MHFPKKSLKQITTNDHPSVLDVLSSHSSGIKPTFMSLCSEVMTGLEPEPADQEFHQKMLSLDHSHVSVISVTIIKVVMSRIGCLLFGGIVGMPDCSVLSICNVTSVVTSTRICCDRCPVL